MSTQVDEITLRNTVQDRLQKNEKRKSKMKPKQFMKNTNRDPPSICVPVFFLDYTSR